MPADPKDAGVDNGRKGRSRRELGATGRETRYFTAKDLEVRSADQTSSGMVEVRGTVIVYGVPYEVNDMWGSFEETIHFGAATDVLAADDLDVRFLFNHSDMPMARTGSPKCPLTLSEDQDGVHVTAFLDPRMNVANDLILAMDPEHRLVTQMSVGMQVDPDGDLWSGSDDYGMPNKRDIVRLANIFDSSAVTYPASTTTSVETDGFARSRHLYEAARSVRSGRGTQAQAEAVMRMLEIMHETRDEPTKEDPKIADAITEAKKAVADAIAAQTKDPDNNTDPADKKILSALQAAEQSLIEASNNQAKDGTPDKPEEGDETKSEDDGDEAQPDPDGTLTEGSGDAPTPDSGDGTGSRAAQLQEELRVRRAAVEATRRRLAVERARLRAQ